MSDWDAFPAVNKPAPRPQTQRQSVSFRDDRDAIARTMLGEAANQGDEGMLAVGGVINNRSARRGLSPSEVVLQRNQFEPWGNPETAQRLMSIREDDPSYQRALALTDRVLAGEDVTGGADHFYAPKVMAERGGAPAWDNGTGWDIGDHRFFALDGEVNAGSADEWDAFPAADSVTDFAAEEITPEGTVNENGFLVDNSGPQFGTEQNPWESRDLNDLIANQDIREGDWVRYDKEGETWLGRYGATGGRGGTPIDQGNGVRIAETGLAQTIGAGALAAAEQLPFMQDSLAFGQSVLRGQSMDEARADIARLRATDQATDQGARNVGGVAGFGITMGLPVAGLRAANQGSRLARAGKMAGVGAVSGGIYGAGTGQGSALERLKQGGSGAVIGGITAPAAPYVAAGAGRVLDPIASRAGQAINSMSGGRVLQQFAPEALAERRIMDSLAREGVTSEQIQDAIQSFQNSGVTPSAIDIIQRVAPGGATARLIRGSALEAGPAATAAERYLQRVEGNLQDNAIGLTRNLTPNNTETAEQFIERTRQARSASARNDYAAPYAERVTPTPEVMASLSDDPGRAALRRARQSAVARQDYNAVAELDALIAGEAQEVSGGVLDAAQRAMGGRARKMEMSPDTRDIAAGLYGRQSGINEFLDTVPGLQEARDVYRGFTRQIEGAELGQTGLNAPPNAFSILPEQIPSAQVGYRDVLEAAIGRPTEGATGVLNRIATSTNQGRNLASAFGEEAAENYRGGMSNLIDQVTNARFLASSSGSQTAPRAIDSLVSVGADAMGGGGIGTITRIGEKLMRGVALSKAEREALVRLGTSESQLRDEIVQRGIYPAIGAPASIGAVEANQRMGIVGPQQ